MKKILVFAFAVTLVFLTAVSPLADLSSATSDQVLDIKDDSNTWIYVVIAVSAVVLAVATAVVISKKVK